MFAPTGTPSRASAGPAIRPFSSQDLPALVAFLNEVWRGHRHYAPISAADFAERVTSQPGFDPQGLLLAWDDAQVIGGVHALRPTLDPEPCRDDYDHHFIAWLAVVEGSRRQGLGARLLLAAQDYLYYCPVYFAAQSTPFYGIGERLWAPWYGSTERMAVSAVNDRDLVQWLSTRGYAVVDAGDTSLRASLHTRERPPDPGLARRGLHCEAISERTPWHGNDPFDRLCRWGSNGGRPYHGLVIAAGDRAAGDRAAGDHAIGSLVWYPLPDGLTAAVAWLGIERQHRNLRFGSYLLDRALVEMAHRGYLYVEVHVHSRRQVEAMALFIRHGFQVIDYWVNLVKT